MPVQFRPGSTITITTWPSRYRPHGRRQRMTWDRLCHGLIARARADVRRKESLPGWAPSSFVDDYRSKAGVVRVYAIGLDIDGNATLDDAARVWRRTIGCAHTTHGHDPGARKLRLRLVLLLSRPITVGQHARVWAWAAERCTRAGFVVDMGACDASRYFYAPAAAPGRNFAWRRWGERPIDVDEVLATMPATKRTTTARAKTPHKVRGGDAARSPTRVPVAPSAARDSFFGRCFVAAGMAGRDLASGALAVQCPWEAEHKSGVRGDGSTVVLPATSAEGWGTWHCSHAHCAARKAVDVVAALAEMAPAALAEARKLGGGRGMTVARVVRARLDEYPDGGPHFPLFRRLRLDLALEDTGEIIQDHQLVIPTYGRHAHAGIRAHYRAALPDVDPASITIETWRSPTRGYRISGRRLVVSVRAGFVQWLRAVGEKG